MFFWKMIRDKDPNTEIMKRSFMIDLVLSPDASKYGFSYS